jgi:hypothetical protein
MTHERKESFEGCVPFFVAGQVAPQCVMFQRIPLHGFCDSVQKHCLAFQELFDNVRVRELND